MKKINLKVLFLAAVMGIGIIFNASIASAKTYDLVLVHGLVNTYRWSDAFLDTCLKTYGSKNVYVLYLDGSTNVTTRTINGRTVYFAGGADTAGRKYVNTQVSYMKTLINKLQANYGLSSSFSLIGHSQGGLVSRQFACQNPGKVAGIVCLGTPNQGSPLAEYTEWLSYLLASYEGCTEASSNLAPSWVKLYFNKTFPVSAISFAGGGKFYTISGRSWGVGSCGVEIYCELYMGWSQMALKGYTNNDGAVPAASVQITGGTHLASYSNYDHLRLVQKADVAAKAISVLK